MESQVVVVGAGLAGLFTAVELMASGVDDVVVLDAEARPGGVARSVVRDGYTLEPGAGTLMLPHPSLTPILERIGAAVVPAVEAGVRYVYTGGRLVELPSSPKVAMTPVASWGAKLRAAAEPFVRAPVRTGSDESVDRFLRRRLGDGVGGRLAWVAASGVFAGDPSRLEVRSAFPALPALEDAAGSIVRGGVRRMKARPKGAPRPTSHVPVGGMTAVAEAAAAALGDRYRAASPVGEIRREGEWWVVDAGEPLRAQHVVLTSRPSSAAGIVDAELAGELRRATSAPVAVVGLGGPLASMPLPPGFGALTGPDAGTATLGVLFESSYAPGRAPAGHALAKVIAGGATRPHVVDWDDDHLVTTVGGEVARILGRPVEASFVEIVRHREGIPQYEVGHRDWLGRLDALLAHRPGLHLSGWGYRGVGVAHLAADASLIARRIVGLTAEA